MLDDICQVAQLKVTIATELELSVAKKYRADIVLFQMKGQIIGLREVKKTSRAKLFK